jgi:hypothetical protein
MTKIEQRVRFGDYMTVSLTLIDGVLSLLSFFDILCWITRQLLSRIVDRIEGFFHGHSLSCNIPRTLLSQHLLLLSL